MVNLDKYTLVVDEQFDYKTQGEFADSIYNGQSGLWTTDTGQVLNGPHSVYIDPEIAQELGVNTYEVVNGELKIKVDVVDDSQHARLKEIASDNPYKPNDVLSDALPYSQANDVNHEGGVDYFTTGQLTTKDSWASTYGYYEIKMSLPQGEGHFPAFWTVSSEGGWPPEIDIIENVGGRDTIISTVILDERGNADVGKDVIYELDLVNNKGLDYADRADFFDLDAYNAGEYEDRDSEAYDAYTDLLKGNGQVLEGGNSGNYEIAAKNAKNEGTYSFKTAYDVDEVLYEAGVTQTITDDIVFNDSIVYAAEWTPEEIVWYVGLDSDHLVEVFRSETPADNTTAQHVLANLQFGGSWAGTPIQDRYDEVLSQTLDIDYIKIFALTPDDHLQVAADQVYIYGTDQVQTTVYLEDDGDPTTVEQGEFTRELNGDDVIVGNNLDNFIDGGTGLDQFTGGGGADTFFVTGGAGNKIITDFNAAQGDNIILEGFRFSSTQDALDSLTQVGDDAWIIQGADPISPQTIILQNTNIADITLDNLQLVGGTAGGAGWHESVFKNVVDGNVYGSDYNDELRSNFKIGKEKVEVEEIHGGEGDDLYVLTNGRTQLVEQEGEGVDTIRTNLKTYTLGDNFEILEGIGKSGQILSGNELNNRILAGEGNDVVAGGAGDDYYDISAGGSDHIISSAGVEYVVGFGIDDSLELADISLPDDAALMQRFAQAGRDVVLDLGAERTVVFRNADLADFSASQFSYTIGESNIVDAPIEAAPVALEVQLRGTAGDDSISGDLSSQRIVGQNGDDTIYAAQGDDTVVSGAGDDAAYGEDGNDRLLGNDGNDSLSGGAGDDVIIGGRKEATDLPDNDLLYGGDGNDRLLGRAGDDILFGDRGADVLFGGGQDDRLYGGAGNDKLRGDAGDDYLSGGSGVDVLIGGAGADVFAYQFDTDLFETDKIKDFNASEGDVLDLQALEWNASKGELSDYAGISFKANGTAVVWADADGAGTAHQQENIFSLTLEEGTHIEDIALL